MKKNNFSYPVIALALSISAQVFAQDIDWRKDPVSQLPAQSDVSALASVPAPQIAAPAANAKPPLFRLDFRCAPSAKGLTPTKTIDRIWIDGNSFTQFDGGYIPYSTLHSRGYELSAAGDKLVIDRNDGTRSPIVMASLGAGTQCAWDGEYWERSVAPLVETTIEIGAPTPCKGQLLDSEMEYSKTAELTVTLKDATSGREAVLKSQVGTASTWDLKECEQAKLGDPKTVYPPTSH